MTLDTDVRFELTSCSDKDPDDVLVAVLGGYDERCLAVFVGVVHIEVSSAIVYQQPSGLDQIPSGADHQRRLGGVVGSDRNVEISASSRALKNTTACHRMAKILDRHFVNIH